MDLPLYSIARQTLYRASSDTLQQSSIELPTATELEVLANKVVKFLLTVQGSDVLDPEYGCGLLEYTQITRNDLPRLQLEIINALERCAVYIKAGEVTGQTDAHLLHSLELTQLEYSREAPRDSVHIYLRITAKTGQEALIDVPVG